MTKWLSVGLLAVAIGGCGRPDEARQHAADVRQMRAIEAERRLSDELQGPDPLPFYREHRAVLDEQARKLEADRAR